MNDKINVIVPCYNVEKYIDRCLDSVVGQTIGLDKLEIICVNDASTDGTWDRLSAWEKRYPLNIRLINCPRNGAQGRAQHWPIPCFWQLYYVSRCGRLDGKRRL